MTNFQTGYAGFKAAIDLVTESFGGDRTRPGVAGIFTDQLYRAIKARTGQHFIPHGLDWTMAEDSDFDCAVSNAFDLLQQSTTRSEQPLEAEWNGAALRLHDTTLFLEGDGYAVPVLKANERNGRWTITYTDAGGRFINANNNPNPGSGKSPSSAYATSRKAALKSLLRMTETFFGVSLTEPADSLKP